MSKEACSLVGLGDHDGHVVGCTVVVPSDLQSQEQLLVLKFLLLL